MKGGCLPSAHSEGEREGGCGTLSLSSKTTRALPLLSSQRPPQPPAVLLLLSQQLHPRPEMSLSLRSGVRGGGTIVSLTDSYYLSLKSFTASLHTTLIVWLMANGLLSLLMPSSLSLLRLKKMILNEEKEAAKSWEESFQSDQGR